MKRLIICSIAVFLISCGGWGGYHYESDRFDYEISFPGGWEVWDKSDTRQEYLIGTHPEIKDAEITVLAVPVSPDLSPHEIYPIFLEGGRDAALKKDFMVEEQSTIHAKNGEGRYIVASYMKDLVKMMSFRTKFLGNRFTLETNATMPEDDYMLHLLELKEMIREIEFKR